MRNMKFILLTPLTGLTVGKRYKCKYRLVDGIAEYHIIGRKGKITRLTTWEVDMYGILEYV